MKVLVKVFATLRENREKEAMKELDEGTTILQVIQSLDIPVDDVAIIMLNGRSCETDVVLKEADVLALFPPVGGG